MTNLFSESRRKKYQIYFTELLLTELLNGIDYIDRNQKARNIFKSSKKRNDIYLNVAVAYSNIKRTNLVILRDIGSTPRVSGNHV